MLQYCVLLLGWLPLLAETKTRSVHRDTSWLALSAAARCSAISSHSLFTVHCSLREAHARPAVGRSPSTDPGPAVPLVGGAPLPWSPSLLHPPMELATDLASYVYGWIPFLRAVRNLWIILGPS